MSWVISESRHAHSSINGDMSVRAKVDTATMEWQRSPISKVWRKRIHLVGSAEAGQVTSLVRYEPGAEFPTHDHPNGEEILVLTGVFGDEHGEWPVVRYPIARTHPISRRLALYFNRIHILGIEGLPSDEASKLLDVLILGKKLMSNGSIVNEEKNTTDNAITIILPKSITGLISENNNDPKATIVVRAV